MADAFQPRFVDLVRNYTITQGTGPFVLGPSVQGFTSFGSALEAGDQFYYSAIGVDKPNEREVGRGTFQADGTIARTPISGAATSFSAGSKTVALIAAAEWFNSVQAGGGSGGGAAVCATRSALASAAVAQSQVLLTETGREGTFVFDGSNLKSMCSADSAQAVYVAPAGQDGSAGAWVRRFAGAHNVKWFGAVGDGSTVGVDGPAFAAALAYFVATGAVVPGSAIYHVGHELFVPKGKYLLGGTTLDLFSTVRLRGEGVGQAGGTPTTLKWDAGATGIRVQRFDTSGAATKDTVTHSGGDGSMIEGLFLQGGFSGAEGEFHGIELRARAKIRDVCIDNFEGDGICCNASASAGDGAFHGNANGWIIDTARITNCRNGLFVDGADTNAGQAYNLDLAACRQWGVLDSSFLGNTYFAPQAATCGITAFNSGVGANGASVVSYGGNRYFAIAGQEAGASTNPPTGTTADNLWWAYSSAGAAQTGIPAWVSGMTARAGGSYFTDNLNARNLFVGPYHETAQGLPQLSTPTLVIGGSMALSRSSMGAWLQTSLGQVLANTAVAAASYTGSDETITAQIGEKGAGAKTLLKLTASATFASSSRLVISGSDLQWNYGNSGANVAFVITGPNTTTAFGGAAAVPHCFYSNNLRVGSGISARLLNTANAPPPTGQYAKGDFLLNFSASATGPFAWQCTTAGTGGSAVFCPLYSGYGTGGIGYSAGAGGTAAQATSKSTGVTLNKLSGQLTMNAASLAAGAAAGFTLTNSQIAATDVVMVSLAASAAADSYHAQVDAVSAGSCRISLRNLSAAALAEAVVLNFAVIKAVAA